jgi:hypothetical protein
MPQIVVHAAALQEFSWSENVVQVLLSANLPLHAPGHHPRQSAA